MTAPSSGSRVCPPLIQRSQDWRESLADQLDAIDQARLDAGIILVMAARVPPTAFYRPDLDVITENAERIAQLRTGRIDDAIQELGQLRAAIRAVCPEIPALQAPGS